MKAKEVIPPIYIPSDMFNAHIATIGAPKVKNTVRFVYRKRTRRKLRSKNSRGSLMKSKTTKSYIHHLVSDCYRLARRNLGNES